MATVRRLYATDLEGEQYRSICPIHARPIVAKIEDHSALINALERMVGQEMGKRKEEGDEARESLLHLFRQSTEQHRDRTTQEKFGFVVRICITRFR